MTKENKVNLKRHQIPCRADNQITTKFPSINEKQEDTKSKWGLLEIVCRVSLIFFILNLFHGSSASVAFDYVPRPEFLETPKELNITSYIGSITRLPCTIRHLGTKRVSWIRGRDLQVLATGRTNFATDIRVSVLPGTGVSKKYKRSHESSLLKGDSSLDNRQRLLSKRKIKKEQTFSETGQMYHYRKHSIENKGLEIPFNGLFYSNKENGNSSLLNISFDKRRGAQLRQPRPPQQSDVHQRKKRQLYTPSSTKIFHKKLHPKIQSFPNESYGGHSNYQSSIAIHPSGQSTQAGDVTSKRTIIPYNYLDGVWEPEDYTLQIKYAERRDAGDYICQINTEPRMSQVIHLTVVDMVAEIIGTKELFVKAGSPVTLSCKVSHDGVLPGFIFWYKEDKLVDYDNSEGRIKIKTNPLGRSKLLLRQAVANDSANYTCEPSGGKPDSVILTVIVDERRAKLQQGSNSASKPHTIFWNAISLLNVASENVFVLTISTTIHLYMAVYLLIRIL